MTVAGIALRTENVTYGWEGSEFRAIEFPKALATLGLQLQREAGENYLNIFFSLTCIDVIKSEEDVYILEPMMEYHIREIKSLTKIVNKIKEA
ncbi:MAG: hypothetical protein M0R80_27700 [Proteobacteria bacterium]|jgi:hypothetical protein|nr:hypothetical protein [Pseudomonadota bacterium]